MPPPSRGGIEGAPRGGSLCRTEVGSLPQVKQPVGSKAEIDKGLRRLAGEREHAKEHERVTRCFDWSGESKKPGSHIDVLVDLPRPRGNHHDACSQHTNVERPGCGRVLKHRG